MHIAEVVTIAKSLPLLRLNTYKSLILSYSADYRRIFRKKHFSFDAFCAPAVAMAIRKANKNNNFFIVKNIFSLCFLL